MSTQKVFTPVFKKKILDIFKVGIGGSIFFCGINMYFNNEKFQQDFVMPLVQKIDPETSHKLSIKLAKYGLVPKDFTPPSSIYHTNIQHLKFTNPLGIAAGYDKNGEAVEALFKMGFSFVEIGSVTPQPQPGNGKPRVFRLPEIEGVINRYGFNSDGHDAVYERLVKLDPPGKRKGVLGVNLGKNKTSPNPIEDYVLGVKKFASVADYLVINVSSPNTPGLRLMQQKKDLQQLVEAVLEARKQTPVPHNPLIFLKIAPDLSQQEMSDIASFVTLKQYKVDGLIVSNTTISRPDVQIQHIQESGGLSGRPLKALANNAVKQMAILTKGQIPIIGVGGISTAEDVYERIKNGASIVQLYTALTYKGPSLVGRIKKDLVKLLELSVITKH